MDGDPTRSWRAAGPIPLAGDTGPSLSDTAGVRSVIIS